MSAGARARQLNGHKQAMGSVFSAGQFELDDFDMHRSLNISPLLANGSIG